MVHYIPGWHRPAPAAGPAASSGSSFGDTILTIALGALALISAHAFDRTNPALATVLRCAAGGVGLIWLFSRCCSSSDGGYSAPASGFIPPGHPVPAPARRTHSSYWDWAWAIPDDSSPIHTRHTHHTTHTRPAPAPAPREFPTAHRAPAQPDPTPMHEVPRTRGGFPTAYPATTTTHTYDSDPHPPRTARTTYSRADASTAYPATSSTSTTKTHTFKPAPPPTHHHPHEPPRTGFTAAAPTREAFPTVLRASAQPDSTPMRDAPKTR